MIIIIIITFYFISITKPLNPQVLPCSYSPHPTKGGLSKWLPGTCLLVWLNPDNTPCPTRTGVLPGLPLAHSHLSRADAGHQQAEAQPGSCPDILQCGCDAVTRSRVTAPRLRMEDVVFPPGTRCLLPVLLWQVGLHLKEHVLPLLYQALGLLDGLLLFGARMGFASGRKQCAGIRIASETHSACAGTQYVTVSGKDTARTGRMGRRQVHDSMCRASSSVRLGCCSRKGSRNESEVRPDGSFHPPGRMRRALYSSGFLQSPWKL